MQHLTLDGMNSKRFPFFGKKKKGTGGRGGGGVWLWGLLRETYTHTHTHTQQQQDGSNISLIHLYVQPCLPLNPRPSSLPILNLPYFVAL